MDLRERVMIAVVEEEEVDARKKIAESFGLTSRWIRKLVQQYRETGSIKPLPRDGSQQSSLTSD